MTTYNNQQNPFLTTIVSRACDQARVNFLDMIYRRQLGGGTPVFQLQSLKEMHEENLDSYMDEAERAALEGNVVAAQLQLEVIIKEWGTYKAYVALIDADGTYLDATNADVRDDFNNLVRNQTVLWATKLHTILLKSSRQRQNDLSNIYAERIDGQFGEYQWIAQVQGDALYQAQQAALAATQQAQQGVQWMMDGVVDLNRQQQIYGSEVAASAAALQAAMAEAQRAQAQSVVAKSERESVGGQLRLDAGKFVTRAGCTVFILVAVVVGGFALAWGITLLTLGIK